MAPSLKILRCRHQVQIRSTATDKARLDTKVDLIMQEELVIQHHLFQIYQKCQVRIKYSIDHQYFHTLNWGVRFATDAILQQNCTIM